MKEIVLFCLYETFIGHCMRTYQINTLGDGLLLKIENSFKHTVFPKEMYLNLKLSFKAVNTLMSETSSFLVSLDMYNLFDTLLVCFHGRLGIWQ